MKSWTLYLILGSVLLLSATVSVCIGTVNLTPGQLVQVLLSGDQTPLGVVVWQLRMPRMVLAILVGASLAMSGAALQGYTRNPLADAGLLGISSGAALGAVCMFYTGFSESASRFLASFLNSIGCGQFIDWFGGGAGGENFWVPMGGLAGAFIALLIVILLVGPTTNIPTLILAGVAVSSLAGALTALVLNLSPNPYAGMQIISWLLGSLTDRSWQEVQLCRPFFIAGVVILMMARRGLLALSLGEEVTASLGFSLKKLRWLIVIGCTLLVGSATAVAGSIAFVGIVVPHLLRPFVKSDPARLLMPSALGGACILLWADIGVRLIPAEQELKLGVLTALVGTPFFLALLLKLRRSYT